MQQGEEIDMKELEELITKKCKAREEEVQKQVTQEVTKYKEECEKILQNIQKEHEKIQKQYGQDQENFEKQEKNYKIIRLLQMKLPRNLNKNNKKIFNQKKILKKRK
ncbi:unnamed protein product [Paramecium primaurelia]|uniref:Uncharacterized protein n=1 Tax=Paramecium primaurelia TaxID=5886 RepID=A0A8S1QF28_PARPR|nr:unnamed protein product [Paramecium primaurelia]